MPKKKKWRPGNTSLENESWFRAWWRPAMAWSYLVICIFDFMIGPIMNGLIAYYTGGVYHEWTPLTLRGGGLYHMAMAAIVGLATWSRGTEKQIILRDRDREDADDRDDDRNDDDRPSRRHHDDDDDPPNRHKGDDAE